MASLCLPNSELHVGLSWDNDATVVRSLSNPERPAVLLFPGPDAPDILLSPPTQPVTLVVVDGTWSQASKLVKSSPLLSALPRYAFCPPAPSIYRIRREPRYDCVSTIEALVHVLGVLEDDPKGAAKLLDPFRRMVDFQLAFAERLHEPRRRHRSARPLPPLPAALTQLKESLICAAGEANTWPRKDATSIPDELVHWVAVRPFTGERFDAMIAPRQPLAVATEEHAEIPIEKLLAGESWDAFAARWNAFLHPGDVLVTWGCYASRLLHGEGGTIPQTHLDCRQILRDRLKHKIGTLEDWLSANGRPIPEPLGTGRAGLRLGMLVDAIVHLDDK